MDGWMDGWMDAPSAAHAAGQGGQLLRSNSRCLINRTNKAARRRHQPDL